MSMSMSILKGLIFIELGIFYIILAIGILLLIQLISYRIFKINLYQKINKILWR